METKLRSRCSAAAISRCRGLPKCWLKHLDFRLSGGYLQNNLQITGGANLSLPHFGASANRATFIFAPNFNCRRCRRNELLSTVVVFFGGVSVFSGNASIFQSNLSTGKTYGIGAHVGWFQLSFRISVPNENTKTDGQLVNDGTRWVASFFDGIHFEIARNDKLEHRWSYSSNRWSAQVGYSLLFYPALLESFQKTLTVQITFRLRSASISVGTVTMPQDAINFKLAAMITRRCRDCMFRHSRSSVERCSDPPIRWSRREILL